MPPAEGPDRHRSRRFQRAVLAAAMRHLREHDELTDVACLRPDLDDNYADTVYNDRWVADYFPRRGRGNRKKRA
ncbi:hypothetical protein [Solwaraspora sp. WMMA2065]|uniref:hypothetical protein n=1 Tax=Solwaraspora sp. WMMA2065 TaxID=3015166 RepID=UPI00259AF85F|nr:hypothetical protein [Solwaraspora sp. WMMA2065]WJK33176.1 hypothetical protein O7610_21005 [Solwaraspora sp. WMMA2065]